MNKTYKLAGKAFLLLAMSGLLHATAALAQQAPASEPVVNIIPRPQELKMSEGSFTITPATRILVDAKNAELKSLANMLAKHFKGLNYNLKVADRGKGGDNNAIVLTISNDVALGKEGYQLSVTPQQVVAKATDPQGVFYALQSIYQLLPYTPTASISIPAMEVKDEPRFGWRGMMLDVGRHFYPVEYVKQFIDYLAMYKMNSFHWHLTEDQGWRIEIKKYPKLAQAAAWRGGTMVGKNWKSSDSIRYGGFYTQAQIKEVVAYAAARYINVVPEIEMPGHSVAALTAYPELSCTGGPFKVEQTWGVFDDVYCAGNEATFKFLEDVLTEVVALFPSKIIHIGGDESPKARWKACSKCQARIKSEGLKDEHELQSYFIKRMENFLLTKGRNIIGWDEILEGGLAPNAAVMSWRGVDGGIAAAKQHHEVVMSPNSHLYFDHYQGKPSAEPLAIGGYNTLARVYAYEPVPKELSAQEAKFIKGTQANLWTEYIPKWEKVQYMVMPRMAALAEVAWTKPELKNWDNFAQRMEEEYKRYDAKGINYATSAYDVRQTIVLESGRGVANVTLATESYKPQIYVTVDGTEPTTASKLYNRPFNVSKSTTIKAAAFKDGKQIGKTSVQQVVIE